MRHVLVTNDFPPKVGGIQSYLYELWRRLPADEVVVLTTAHAEAAAWDAEQAFRIERVEQPFLIPSPALVQRIDRLVDETEADLVLLDPAWPLGSIGPLLEHPYGVVLHGAEVTVPARLPFAQLLLRATLRHSRVAIAAGGYPAAEGKRAAGRAIPTVQVPPGVDTARFVPLTPDQRLAARARHGIDPDAQLVLCVSRLVPRKGIDVLLQAVARLAEDYPRLRLVVAGAGRDRGRLEQLAEALGAPASFLGRVEEAELPDLYGCADVFAMLCRDRWGGLEQEGFGIVFLEAAATGVPSLAGRSGGSAEAVLDGETGFVLDEPRDVDAAEDALAALLDDDALRVRMGRAARARALEVFAYDRLVGVLAAGLEAYAPAIEEPSDEPVGSFGAEPVADVPVADVPLDDA